MAPSSPSPVSIPDFAAAHLALLADELAAETALTSAQLVTASPAALARAGLAARNLVLGSRRTGLGGKIVLELAPDPAVGSSSSKDDDGASPSHDLRVGDVVRVAPQPKGRERKREARALEGQGADGVVVKVGRGSGAGALEVALDREDEGEEGLGGGGRLWAVKLANEVTFRRMNWTLEQLRGVPEGEHTSLVRVLFGAERPTPWPADLEDPQRGAGLVAFLDPTLNDAQRDAIRFALAAKEVALIHGPPGTGKTYTLVELIRQLVARGQRVLVCGPSNVSVDNLVERLAPHGVPMVRLGHPARLLPSVLGHALEVLTRTSDAGALVRDVRREMDDKQASIKKTRNGRERRAIYGEIRELRKEYREREQRCVGSLVRGARVVLATLHGAGGYQVRRERFDVVVIDEASQALEAQCWIPLLTASKVVLAGDHLQLPPTVKSSNSNSNSTKNRDKSKIEEKSQPQAKMKGFSLETTLFDRLLALHGPTIKRMLTTQYRMHEAIMRFPSAALYEDRLVAADAVKARLLTELQYGVADTEDTREPLVFWDTQGGDFPERADADSSDGAAPATKAALLSDSKSNDLEAALAARHVARVVEAGVAPEDIAVVTPYNAQLGLLSERLRARFPGIELGSVDGFQGREKEAVIVSLVRSNPDREVGFLGEKRRLNVAMTRPKRHLCVIGDSATVGRGSAFLKRWMGFLEAEADLRYPDASELNQS